MRFSPVVTRDLEMRSQGDPNGSLQRGALRRLSTLYEGEGHSSIQHDSVLWE